VVTQLEDKRSSFVKPFFGVSYYLLFPPEEYFTLSHYPWDFLVIGIVSFGFYQWGIHSWTTTDLAAAEKVNQRVSRD
jgi:hypothetical protein